MASPGSYGLDEDVESYVGGMSLSFPLAHWGWPGVRLTVLRDGVVLGPSANFLRFVVPTRVFYFNDLGPVEAVGKMWIDQGIRFISKSSGSWAIFWTTKRSEMLDSLDSLVPEGVERIPRPYRLFKLGHTD